MKKFGKTFFIYKSKKSLIKLNKISFSEKKLLSEFLKTQKNFKNRNLFLEEKKNNLEYLKKENWELITNPKSKKIILKKELENYKLNLFFFSKSKNEVNYFPKSFLTIENTKNISNSIFLEFYLQKNNITIDKLYFINNPDYFYNIEDLNNYQIFNFYNGPKFFKLNDKFKDPIYKLIHKFGLNKSIIFIMNFEQKIQSLELVHEWYEDFENFFNI